MRRPAEILLLLVVAHLPAGCSRPAGPFSEQNARAHVGMLAGTIGTRAVGTAPNERARAYVIDQLRLFGFEVRVQEADARRAALGRTARVSNIIAVRTGKRSEAVALVSHYDSVPMGPGAGDDALGVGVSLEAARVLAARADANWTLMILITDGEEAGLMGAAALMTDRDVTSRLQAYVNLESIGSAGPPMLFEVGPGNGWLLEPWARAAPLPRGGSFITEVYKRLPSDTDFSIFKLSEIPGLNFAAVGDSYGYHTSRDTAERLSADTIRRAGEQVVAIVTALDSIDITQRSNGDRTFFDIASATALSYGPVAGIAIALAALVLAVVAWVKVTAAAVRLGGVLRWLITCLWILAGATLVVASMIATTWALRAAREVYHPWYARPGRLFLLLLAVGITIGWAVARLGQWLPKRMHGVRHPSVVWSVTLPAWAALGGAALWFVPGAAYLWLLPLFVAGALLTVSPVSNAAVVRAVSVAVLAVAGTFWVRDTSDLLQFIVAELGRQPIVTPAFVFTVMIAAAGVMVVPPFLAAVASTRPILHPALGTALCLFAVAGTAGFAYVAPAYTPDHPLRRYARVVQDGDGQAVWDVASIEPGIDLGEGAPTGWMPVGWQPPVSAPVRRLPHPFVFRTSTPSIGPAPIGIASIAVEPVAAGIELSVTVVPRHQGLSVSFVLPAGLEPARSSLPGVQRLGRWTATYVAPPPEGIAFRASFGGIAAGSLKDFRVLVSYPGSPAGQGWQFPSWLPRERTAWMTEATWIVDPLSLPIAPVPPLR
jgi:Peptidase family M28